MPAATLAAANRRGIACICAAMICLVVNDMLMKKLGEALPLPQLIVMRGSVAALLILALARATGATRRFAQVADRRVLLRALIDTVGTLVYLASLMHLPLANATAINLASPLVIALMAVLLLGERPGAARWLAIGGGFGGVLLIVQPAAAGFSGWSWACLAATLFQASRDLLTRHISATVPALLVTLANAVCVTLAGALWMALTDWQPVGARQALLVAAAATLLSLGYWLIVLGMRHGEMSVVAPFRYVGLLAALALGWLVWRDVPNALATAGIALLLGTGIYLLHEQRAAAR
ncbi:MAG: DMT family transporter [Rubrivivax sp.]